MKQITNFLFSTKLTIILLIIFATAIGVATFIEDRFDTTTAKILVYNARWLELIYVLMILNFIGNINKYNLISWKKAPGLLIHLAFIILIIGAGITRYFSISGIMYIREGQSSNKIYSSDPYLQAIVIDSNKQYAFERHLYLSEIANNSFHKKVRIPGKGKLDIKYRNFIRNAVEKIEENVEGGLNILEFAIVGRDRMETIILKDGETKDVGGTLIAFNNSETEEAIKVTLTGEKLNMISPVDIVSMKMMEGEDDTIFRNTTVELKEKSVYKTPGSLFLFSRLHRNAKQKLVRGDENERGVDALTLDVFFNGKRNEVTVSGGSEYISRFHEVDLDGLNLQLAYGSKQISLPFSLYLNDFILERYAGSMSPSSFESKVKLIDTRKNLEQEHRIFMNNVLDYDGYRFFQSSYDEDERGTILSVNRDFLGTWISYLAYFLLGAGFILTLLSRNSRFFYLSRKIKELRIKRKSIMLIMVFAFGIGGLSFSQIQKPVSQEHTHKLGHIVVQTYNGRFQPLNTLATDVMHKISRKDIFESPQKGKMDCMQVFLDMSLDPEFWRQQRVIYIREKSVRDVLGIKGKYASFNDFFTQQSKYKLSEYIEIAFRKKQSEQNKFDKEIIKVDERVNISMMMFDGSLLKIFPVQGSVNNVWVSATDTLAFVPLSGPLDIIKQDLNLPVLNYNNLMYSYLTSVLEAVKTGDYSRADRILGYFEAIQKNSGSSGLLPSTSKIKSEIRYNNAKIFVKLKNVYGILSIILLSLAFIDNLSLKKTRFISASLTFFIFLLGLAFLYHSYGLGLRWYLSGHAPWSNGYEALLLIAWGGLLAGFIYLRYSKITLASTALLGFFILMTAGHSSYDPQLTNLQPVLKSYWLIIHVAVITISYGFLGSGFILGVINLLIYLFKTPTNSRRLNLTTEELTYINEMNLTIGLFLATMGTFLGGVWANESWGRYWGWDAKETWALAIIITYAIILHFRLVPKLKSEFIFNAASVISFGTVIMTFVGVNYYLSKGLHSYAADETPVFPAWAWGIIISLILLIIFAGVKEDSINKSEAEIKK